MGRVRYRSGCRIDKVESVRRDIGVILFKCCLSKMIRSFEWIFLGARMFRIFDFRFYIVFVEI